MNKQTFKVKITQECVWESCSGGEVQSCDSDDRIEQSTHSDERGVERWNIDRSTALEQLKRALGTDCSPPALVPIATPQRPLPQGNDLIGKFQLSRFQRKDAATIMRETEQLLDSLGIPPPTDTFVSSVESLYNTSLLLQPQIIEEIIERIDFTIKDCTQWASSRDDVVRAVECNSMQLADVVDFVKFLNIDVRPSLEGVMRVADHLRCLRPLYCEAWARLEDLKVLLEADNEVVPARKPDDDHDGGEVTEERVGAARPANEMTFQLNEIEDAIGEILRGMEESRQAVTDSLDAFRLRIAALKRRPKVNS